MSGNSRWIKFGALAAVLLLISGAFLAGQAEAKNPVSSRWVKNLSGDEPPGENWDDRICEVAVSGNFVHVLWYSYQYQAYEKVYYCRSVDGGQTFEAKVALYAEPYPANRLSFDNEEKHLAVDGATVHVAFYQDTPTRQVRYFRSGNNGADFTPQTFTEVDGVAGNTYISAHQGKVNFTTLRNWYGWQSIVVYTSTDDGQTWANNVAFGGERYLPLYIKDLQRYDDHVHLLYRMGLDGTGLHFSANCISSLDDGVTFPHQQLLTTPTPDGQYLNSFLQNENYVPHLAVEGDNVLVVWGQNDLDPYLVEWGSLYYRRSTDKGVSFSDATLLERNQADGIGNMQFGCETVVLKGSYAYVVFLTTDSQIYLRRSGTSGAAFAPRQKLTATGLWDIGGGWWPTVRTHPTDGAQVHIFSKTCLYWYSGDGGATVTKPVFTMPIRTSGNQQNGAQLAVGADGVPHLVDSLRYSASPEYDADVFYRRLAPPGPPTGNMTLQTLSNSDNDFRYDCMVVPSSSYLNFDTKLSAEVWVKPLPGGHSTGTTADEQTIFQKVNTTATGGGYFGLFTTAWGVVSGRQPGARLVTTAGAYYLVTDTVRISDNVWTHLAMTYDAAGGADNFKLYMNGALIASTTATGDIVVTDDVFLAGYLGAWNLDELRLWNRVLTQQEIRDGMYATLSGTETDLAAYWNFNNTTKDITGHGNDGLLIYSEEYLDSTRPTTKPNSVGVLQLLLSD